MSEAEAGRQSAEDGIRRTLAEYCLLVDDGKFGHWAELFAVDAVLKGNGAVVSEGRAAILKWVTEAVPTRAGGKHMTVNSVIQVAGDSATVSSDFFYLTPSKEGPLVACAGRYVDELVREPDRWRFAARDIRIAEGWVRMSAWPKAE